MGDRHVLQMLDGRAGDLARSLGESSVRIRICACAARAGGAGRDARVRALARLRHLRAGRHCRGSPGAGDRGRRAPVRRDAALLDEFRQDRRSQWPWPAGVAEVRSEVARLRRVRDVRPSRQAGAPPSILRPVHRERAAGDRELTLFSSNPHLHVIHALVAHDRFHAAPVRNRRRR